jgi:hypothetical protein
MQLCFQKHKLTSLDSTCQKHVFLRFFFEMSELLSNVIHIHLRDGSIEVYTYVHNTRLITEERSCVGGNLLGNKNTRNGRSKPINWNSRTRHFASLEMDLCPTLPIPF